MNFGLMMQMLLEDRFQLKVHRETRESPVYDLTLAKSGVSKTLAAKGTPFRRSHSAPETTMVS
jgi:uncharacterized protein (TIGR03435 family)